MQIRGTTTSRNKTKEEEEKRRKGQPAGTKQTGNKPKTNATKPKTAPQKPKTAPQKPKMTEAKAGAQQSRTNTRTNTTRTQLTDGPTTSRKPMRATGQGTSGVTVTRGGNVSAGSGGKFSSPKQTAAMLRQGNRVNPVQRMQRGQYEADRRKTTEEKNATHSKLVTEQKRNERIKEIENQLAQIRRVKDDRKAEAATKELPKKVVDLLDRYNDNQTVLAGLQSDKSRTKSGPDNYMRSVMDDINRTQKQLEDMGYKNWQELAGYRKRITDKESGQKMEAEAAAFAQKHPVLGAAAARAITPAAAVAGSKGVAQSIADGVIRKLTGKEDTEETLNTYDAAWMPTRLKNAMDEGVMTNFNDSNTARFLYQTGMSGLDSAGAMALSLTGAAGAGTLGALMLGAGAMNETVLDVTERGGTKAQALFSGIAAGVAETLFEKVSIGEFSAMKDVPVKSVRDAFENVGRQVLVNYSEEKITEMANSFTDYWINGGNSEYYDDVLKYGKKRANEKLLGKWEVAGLGGALMGGAFGASGSAMGALNYNSAVNQRGAQIGEDATRKGNIISGAQDVIDSGVLDKKTTKKAQQLLDKANAGVTAEAETATSDAEAAGTAPSVSAQAARSPFPASGDGKSAADARQERRSNRAAAQLEVIVGQATDRETAQIVTKAAQERLQELGETEDSGRVAQAIGEIVTGTAKDEKAAKRALQTIAQSKFGQQVFDEVSDTEGQLDSGWTRGMLEEIGALEGRRYYGEKAEAASGRGGEGGETSSTTPQAARSPFSASGDGKGAAGTMQRAVQGMSAEGQEAAAVYFENQVLKGEVKANEEQIYKKEFADIYRWSRDGQITEKQQAIEEETLSGLSDSAKAAAFDAGRKAARAAASNVEAEETTTSSTTPQAARSPFSASGDGRGAAGTQRQIVTGIESVSDEGEVIMRTQDGGTVALSDAGLDHESTWIAQQAAEYGGQTADDFFNGFAPGVSPSSYNNAFSTYYNAGQLGKQTFEQFRQSPDGKIMLRYLGEATARKAFEAGRASSNRGGENGATSPVRAQERAATFSPAGSVGASQPMAARSPLETRTPASGDGKGAAGVQKKRGSKREGSYTSKAAMDEAVDTMLQALSKKTGIDVERLPAVFAGKMEANGKFIRGVVKILLSENAQNEFATLFHELTHAGAAYNLNGYAGYMGAILQWYQQNYGHNSLKERLQEIYSVYHANDASFTESKAVEEFVCEATAGLFSTEDGAQDFVDWLQNESGYTAEQKKTVLQRVAELFQRIVDRIKELIGDGNLSEIAADFAEAQADEAARLRQMFLDVLDGMEVREQDTGNRAQGEKYSLQQDEDGYFVNTNVQVSEKDAGMSTAPEGQFSLRMAEEMDKLRLSLGLEAQNRSLLQQNEQLRELNRRQGAQIREMQKTLTQSGVETFADSRKVEQFAGRIQRDYKTTRGAAARAEIARQLEDLYHDMANNVTSRDVTQTRAEELAEQILKESDYNQPQVSEYSQAVIDDVKSVGVQLSDAQKAEAAYRYGSYGAFYRASMGAMKIRNDGMPLDQRWAELAEAHPAVFDAEASEADQALLLFEAVWSLQNDYIDDNGFDFDEAKEFLAGQILDGFRDAVGSAQALPMKQRQNIRKELDARQATIEKLKAKIKQERAQAKAQAKEDVRKAKTEAAAAVRAEFDDKFLANRARYEQRVQNIAETQRKGSQRRYIEKRITRFQRMLAPTRGNDNIVQPLRELVGRVIDIIPQSGREQIKRDSWNELEIEYRNLRDNNEDFAGIYGDVFATIGQDIEQMKEETSGKRFSQLTLRQLQTMARIMDHINAMVKNEQEVIIDGRKQRAAAAGQQAMEEAAQNAQQRKFNVGDNLRTFDVNNQKPVYFFRRIGGVMQQLFNDTRKGQDVWARNVQKGKQFFSETFEKHRARDWMQDEQTFTLHDWQGRAREDVTLTVGQMLSLYATAKREGVVARRFGEKQTMHLLGGGFCFEDQWVKKGSGKDAHYEMEGDAHQLTVDDVMAIANALTDEQRAYADEMVRYLSTDMAKLGNDVTMQLYGFNMFNEGYYFPLNVKKTFLFQKFGEQGESMLQAMGFTNATKHNANPPIILSEFDQVWAGHVERMSAYNALVIPINSMQRVWNYKENAGEIGQMKQKTMAQTFTQSYGKAYASYFQQFMRDINGDVVGDKREEALNGLIRRFKKNAVFASASVTIQQPSAVMRAMAYIDPKYFAATAGVNRSKMYAEAKQYSGLAIIKELGGFDVGSGRTAVDWMMEAETKPRTAKEKAAALVDFKDSSYRDDIFGKPAGKADEMTWAHIWAACKKQVQVEERLSGEALNERTAEVFNNVIDLTQVYDSVFSRSANMRSKSGLMQAATAFMGEPTTTINMLEDALRSKDKKFATKVVAACTAQILFNAALKSIITAARDDDEDKNPFEKYVAQLFGNFLDDLNPLGMVPYFRDVLSLLKGFDVGRSELAVVEDLIDTFKKVMTGDDPFSWESVKGLLGAIGPFIDLPARNVLRDVDAIGNTVRGFQSGTKPTKAGAWYAIKQELLPVAKNFGIVTEDTKAEQLYAAFVSEDDEMYARMAQKYKTGAAVKNALVGQIKTAYEGGEITKDEAVELLLRLPAYNEQKAQQETRHWVIDLQDELFEMEEAENAEEKTGGYYTLDSMKRDKEEADAVGYQVTTDWTFLQNAVQQQDAKAIKEEIAQLKQFGKSEEDIQEKLRLYIKNNDKDVKAAGEKYKNGDVSVMSEGALGMIASRYGIESTEVMRMIRTEAGVSNSPIEGTIWQLNDLKRAIESGSSMTYDIKWSIVKAKEQQFKDKKNPTNEAFQSLRSSLTSYFKPKYQAADAAGREKIRQQLKAAACWPNEAMLNSTLRKWAQG